MGSPTDFDVLRCNSIISPQLVEASGQVWFVGNGNFLGGLGAIGASDGNDGMSPMRPFATLGKAVTMTVSRRGDVIYLLPGHDESLIATQTIAKAGTQIIGLGVGNLRPTFQFTGAIDGFNVSGSGIRIRNLIFNISGGGTQTAKINLAGSTNTIEGCLFYAGVNDADLITVPATGDYSKILKNEFIVTAPGPTSAIVIEASTTTGTQIIGNYFDGNSVANAWVNGAIFSTVAHTNFLGQMNVFRFGTGFNFTAAATGYIVWNYGGGVYVPGNCEVLMPGGGGAGAGAGGGGFAPDSGGSSAGTPQTVAPESTTGTVYYVHTTGADVNDGLTPLTPKQTLAGAVAAATTRKGDIILLMPGYIELLTGSVTINKEGVKIIGMSSGVMNQPAIGPSAAYAGATAAVVVGATGVEIAGVKFQTAANAASAAVANLSIGNNIDDVYIHDCYFRTGVGAGEITSILFAGISARTNIENNIFETVDSGINPGAASAISNAVGVLTDCEIIGNVFYGFVCPWDTSAIYSNQANVNYLILKNSFFNLAVNTHAIQLTNASTGGVVDENFVFGNTLEYGIVARGTGMMVGPKNSFSQDSALTGKMLPQTTGAVLYVNSAGGSDLNHGRSPAAPLASLAAAITTATANNSDTIVLMPGHAETPVATITVDKAGIKIYGMVYGTTKPYFGHNLGAPADVFDIAANNVELYNISIGRGAAAVTALVNIGAAGFVMSGCDFEQGATPISCVTIPAAGFQPKITNCSFTMFDADGALNAISIENAAAVGIVIESCTFVAAATAANAWDNAPIDSAAVVPLGVVVKNCTCTGLKANTYFVAFAAGANALIKGNTLVGPNITLGCLATPQTMAIDDDNKLFTMAGGTTAQKYSVLAGVYSLDEGAAPGVVDVTNAALAAPSGQHIEIVGIWLDTDATTRADGISMAYQIDGVNYRSVDAMKVLAAGVTEGVYLPGPIAVNDSWKLQIFNAGGGGVVNVPWQIFYK